MRSNQNRRRGIYDPNIRGRDMFNPGRFIDFPEKPGGPPQVLRPKLKQLLNKAHTAGVKGKAAARKGIGDFRKGFRSVFNTGSNLQKKQQKIDNEVRPEQARKRRIRMKNKALQSMFSKNLQGAQARQAAQGAQQRAMAQATGQRSSTEIIRNARIGLAEACWKGYKAKGMKKKGNRMVPNCVPESKDPRLKTTRATIHRAGGDADEYSRLKAAKAKEANKKPKPKAVKRDTLGRSDSKRLTPKQQDALRKKEAAEARAKIRLAAARVRKKKGSKKAQRLAAKAQRGKQAVPMNPHPQGTSTERKDQIEKNRREAASGKAAARLRKEIADDDARRAAKKRAEG